jgi:peptidoglycan/LPS O-acetylase OafA/YrhL
MKQTGRIAVGKFYLRRLLRLYPVIVFAMALCIAFALLRVQRLAPLEIASVFFYFTNYLIAYRELHPAQVTLPIGVFWSLSVEEHFYLLFPAGFGFFRGNPIRIAQLAVAVCVLCLVIRCVYLLIWPEWIGTLATYWRSETRFDSIAFGVLMAAACELPRGRAIISSAIKPAIVIAAATAIVLSFAFRQPFYQSTFRFTIQSLALFPVIGSVIAGFYTRRWRVSAFTRVEPKLIQGRARISRACQPVYIRAVRC